VSGNRNPDRNLEAKKSLTCTPLKKTTTAEST
jgi:hypothetical protein